MITHSFSEAAHNSVLQSLEDIQKGDYLQSWIRSPLSRVYFLADAVSNAVLIPLTCIKLAFGALQAFYTWGHQSENFWQSTKELDYRFSRLCLSSLGAIISPATAYHFRDLQILTIAAYFALNVVPHKINIKLPAPPFSANWSFSTRLT